MTLLKKIFVALCSIGFIVTILEATFWISFYGKDVPWGPGVKWYQQKYYVLNQGGYRDREHTQKKPDGTFRIIVLGDSFSFPANVRNLEDGYVYQLEQKLNARVSKRSIEVINLSKTGFNTKDQEDLLSSVALSYNPDVVLVGYVLNDADPNRAPTHLVPPLADSTWEELVQVRQAVRKALVEGNWEWMRSYVKLRLYTYSFVDIHLGMLASRVKGSSNWFEQETRGLYTGDPLYKQTRTIKRLIEAASLQNATTSAALFPYFYKLREAPFAREHQAVQQTFEHAGAKVLDLYPVFGAMEEDELVLGWWDPHPNEKAHAIAAGEIANWLIAEKLVPVE